MNTPLPPHDTRRRSRLAQLGVVLGAIMGILGTMAGFYFGVVVPAVESGRWQELPTRSIWLGAAVLLLLLIGSVAYLYRWFRKSRRSTENDW